MIEMASLAMTNEQVFIGPGLSPFKRIVTILGLIGVIALIFWIAYYQVSQGAATIIVSTIIAILFVAGFAYYLRMIAPVPFTITLTPQALVKSSRRGEIIELPWADLTRIKEEFFPNGKRIGITVYRKVTQPGQKAKAWAVYRDDVTNIDGLAEALKQAIPETCTWESETVHE